VVCKARYVGRKESEMVLHTEQDLVQGERWSDESGKQFGTVSGGPPSGWIITELSECDDSSSVVVRLRC